MQNRLISFLYFLIFFYIFSISNSYGYLDPGTGSFIIQSIMIILGSILFYIGYPLRLIKNLYKKIFKKRGTDKEKKSINK